MCVCLSVGARPDRAAARSIARCLLFCSVLCNALKERCDRAYAPEWTRLSLSMASVSREVTAGCGHTLDGEEGKRNRGPQTWSVDADHRPTEVDR